MNSIHLNNWFKLFPGLVAAQVHNCSVIAVSDLLSSLDREICTWTHCKGSFFYFFIIDVSWWRICSESAISQLQNATMLPQNIPPPPRVRKQFYFLSSSSNLRRRRVDASSCTGKHSTNNHQLFRSCYPRFRAFSGEIKKIYSKIIALYSPKSHWLRLASLTFPVLIKSLSS